LRAPLLDAIQRGVPFLGVCLGLQALYETSEEAPELSGLHLLPGSVRSLPPTVKLPHMGWNQLKLTRPSRLLEGIPADAYFYFAHSFAATNATGEAAALCNHGSDFTAVIEKQNIFAVQFHPEKSGDAGAQLLRNFLRLAA
jgi:glutamine amidotransferase